MKKTFTWDGTRMDSMLKRSEGSFDAGKLKKGVLQMSSKQLIEKVQKLSKKRILGSSGKRIPNIREIVFEVMPYNPGLQSVGINKRLPVQIKTKPLDPRDRLNRYVTRQVRRLRYLRSSNPVAYGDLAWLLMDKSVAFKVMAVQHVMPKWWFEMPMGWVGRTLKRVGKLVRAKDNVLSFRRVGIPKAGGKGRPLGVPTMEGRVYLHMVNNFLVEFTAPSLLSCQHGYRPGKGTLSAWREVIKKVIDKRYVFETDLKGFFDTVSLRAVQGELLKLGMPGHTIDFFMDLNLSMPRFGEQLEGRIDPGRAHVARYDKYLMGKAEKGEFENLFYEPGTRYPKDMPSPGVAQGSPTSPMLSILVLKEYLGQCMNVNYADDQVFASNASFEVRDIPSQGVVHSGEKCAGIKRDGRWLRPLVFLGLKYDGETGVLENKRGEKENTEIPLSLAAFMKSAYRLKRQSLLKALSGKAIFGYFQAAMYMGEGDLGSEELKLLGKNHDKQIAKGSGAGARLEGSLNSSIATKYLANMIKNNRAITRGKVLRKIRFQAFRKRNLRPIGNYRK